mmetsp:Transcript_72045/g.168592  ORF Transcript_72045/g.168592 Transcript_72045/m.168592 type:complete len:103 (+) Transcript_72045:590-898(+)
MVSPGKLFQSSCVTHKTRDAFYCIIWKTLPVLPTCTNALTFRVKFKSGAAVLCAGLYQVLQQGIIDVKNVYYLRHIRPTILTNADVVVTLLLRVSEHGSKLP